MDRIDTSRRSANMRAIKSKGMKPEMIVRSLAHRLGYRFRLHAKDLPGKPDLVFRKKRRVIFVHGCFWHMHSAKSCKISRTPKSNQEYWLQKLNRNRRRDRQVRDRLRRMGWKSLVIWECQTKNPKKLANRIKSFLET